jgi:hypothetical protein
MGDVMDNTMQGRVIGSSGECKDLWTGLAPHDTRYRSVRYVADILQPWTVWCTSSMSVEAERHAEVDSVWVSRI